MITVTILTKNSAKRLKQVLDALRGFPEVLILDNGSTDDTLSLAAAYENATVRTAPFTGFGPLHNLAATLAQHDWIFSVDSDEIVSDELAREILQTKLDAQTVYSLPRHTYYRGRWIKCCGWYPDRIVRLYNRKSTRFSDDLVHERILSDHMREAALTGPLIHYSYEDVHDFLQKMQSYSDLFAKQNVGKKRSSPAKALIHAWGAFLKNYFLKKGCLYGYRGLLIASYQAHTAFYKYLKLYEAQCDSKKLRG